MADEDEKPAPPTFAEGLRDALKAARVSQKDLSRRLAGVTMTTVESEAKRSQILKWLRGKHEPELENAAAIEQALGLEDGQLQSLVVRKQRGRAASLTRQQELEALRGELGAVRAEVAALAADLRLLREELGHRREGQQPAPASSGGRDG